MASHFCGFRFHIFVSVSSSGMGAFVKKIKGMDPVAHQSPHPFPPLQPLPLRGPGSDVSLPRKRPGGSWEAREALTYFFFRFRTDFIKEKRQVFPIKGAKQYSWVNSEKVIVRSMT